MLEAKPKGENGAREPSGGAITGTELESDAGESSLRSGRARVGRGVRGHGEELFKEVVVAYGVGMGLRVVRHGLAVMSGEKGGQTAGVKGIGGGGGSVREGEREE